MIILGLDLETTGTNHITDRIIEIGLVLWDVASEKPVRLTGYLVKPDDFDTIDPKHWAEAEAIHHISQETVNKFGVTELAAMNNLILWMNMADAVLAYFGTTFDKPFCEVWHRRLTNKELPKKLWIDMALDFPEPITGRLTYVAADNGFLNPFPHRAVTDVLTMLKVASKYDLTIAHSRAQLPKIVVQATVDFAHNKLAKNRGYIWRPETRRWLRLIPEMDLKKEQAEAGFIVKNLGLSENLLKEYAGH